MVGIYRILSKNFCFNVQMKYNRLSNLFICLMDDMNFWTRDSMITNFVDNTQSVVVKDEKLSKKNIQNWSKNQSKNNPKDVKKNHSKGPRLPTW